MKESKWAWAKPALIVGECPMKIFNFGNWLLESFIRCWCPAALLTIWVKTLQLGISMIFAVIIPRKAGILHRGGRYLMIQALETIILLWNIWKPGEQRERFFTIAQYLQIAPIFSKYTGHQSNKINSIVHFEESRDFSNKKALIVTQSARTQPKLNQNAIRTQPNSAKTQPKFN